ncbi:MAG: hypothetical protein JNJ58_03975 [Chitinophagaceae bacterium]|nr:hypothetical protein [Chitinophagaceae bacterium]
MKKLILPVLALIALAMVTVSSCVKQKFDSPPDPSNVDPKLAVNTTIWELRQMLDLSGFSTPPPVQITSDLIISGIVSADDRSGNLYKQIMIQDTSSGIVVMLGRASLYNDFPVGRKVYIKCKGLYLGSYGKFHQLGYLPDLSNSLSDIPSSMISKFVVKANYPNPVVARPMSIDQLNNLTTSYKWLGSLIQIDSAEFTGADAGAEYAQDPNIASGTEREIEDCAASKIVIRTSGYCNFRTALTPVGRGPLTAIYSRYNSTPQLLIRDTNDVKFTGERCGSNATLITVDSLRKMFISGTTAIPNGYKIKAIVISDKSTNNFDARNITIQEGNSGIVARFESGFSNNSFAMGDEVEINVSGATLSEYQGLLQVNANSSKMLKISSGNTVVPTQLTFAQILANFEAYESTLVKVLNVTFPTGNYYQSTSGYSISDGTGSMIFYTRSAATFGTQPLPTTPKTMVGIIGEYAASSAKQISIRNLNDIQ